MIGFSVLDTPLQTLVKGWVNQLAPMGRLVILTAHVPDIVAILTTICIPHYSFPLRLGAMHAGVVVAGHLLEDEIKKGVNPDKDIDLNEERMRKWQRRSTDDCIQHNRMLSFGNGHDGDEEGKIADCEGDERVAQEARDKNEGKDEEEDDYQMLDEAMFASKRARF